MYLKCHSRLKDGKTHHYWNVVEHVAGAAGRRFERQVLYLGELGVEEKRDWEARIERKNFGVSPLIFMLIKSGSIFQHFPTACRSCGGRRRTSPCTR